jgi:hypothetical protein
MLRTAISLCDELAVRYQGRNNRHTDTTNQVDRGLLHLFVTIAKNGGHTGH